MTGSETHLRFSADVAIAVLPLNFVFIPVRCERGLTDTLGPRAITEVLEGSQDVFAAIGMGIEMGEDFIVAVVDTESKADGLRRLDLFKPEERSKCKVVPDSTHDFRLATRQTVLLTRDAKRSDIDTVASWIHQQQEAYEKDTSDIIGAALNAGWEITTNEAEG